MHSVEPLIPPQQSLPEITLKVIVLAVILTAVLGAANAYLALKVGMTVASSIPAAVLAIGIFRLFKNSNVLEANIVQTIASAGEGIAQAVCFVVPAFVILGFWKNFHYLEIAVIVIVGGALGILLSVPLRRVLLSHKALSFPEGTAIGHMLIASKSSEGNQTKNMIFGSIVGATIVFLQNGLKVLSEKIGVWFVGKSAVFGFGMGFNPALVALGYILGANSAATLLIGAIIGWLIGIPVLSHIYGFTDTGNPGGIVEQLWSDHLRYVGVGIMMLGGLWTILNLLKPIYDGLRYSFEAMRDGNQGKQIPRTEKDIPLNFVLWGMGVLAIIVFFTFMYLLKVNNFGFSNTLMLKLVFIALTYILVGGFISASLCGYLAGLVGSSNTPNSGILLCSVLLLSLIFAPILGVHLDLTAHADKVAAGSVVLLITAIVGCVSVSANDNIQDLKAGQMVGATPWKQQTILFLGFIVSAIVIGPVLELLFSAYGIGNVFPRPDMDASQVLQAPQASIMAAVTQGVFGHSLNWSLLIAGALIAATAIAIDELIKHKGYRLPVMSIGIGLYLSVDVATAIAAGGFAAGLAGLKLKNAKVSEESKQNAKKSATLMACGLVAGAALMGVILAIPFVLKGSSDALRIVPASFKLIAELLGLLATLGICFWFYKKTVAVKQSA